MKFDQLISLFQETHKELQTKAIRTIDIALVVRNWLFGWYIVEYEQQGEDRAKYGSYLIDEISKNLNLKGTSPTNLRKFREFYMAYSEIQQTVSVKSLYSEKGDLFSFASIRQALSTELIQHRFKT